METEDSEVHAMATLGKFAAEYPGPEVLARNDRNDQWRQELSQQVRGSMIGGQSHRTAAGENQSKEWRESRSVEGREGIPSSIQGMTNWPGARVVAGQQSQPHLSLSGRSQEVAERRADLDGYNYRVGRVPELGEYMNVPRVKKRSALSPFWSTHYTLLVLDLAIGKRTQDRSGEHGKPSLSLN